MASSDAEVVARVRQAVTTALDASRLVRSWRPLVVGVSGGADSLCLLDALASTAPRAASRVIVGHVDHRLRDDSAGDAEYVREVAAGYGLRCDVIAVDVPALAAREGRGIEEAARLGRYRALRDVPIGLGTPAVATGHTRDDSVETVLLHLLRGTGLRGLGGISADETLSPEALGERPVDGISRQLRLVRPLLDVTRAETVAYCQARGIRWLTDETNTDPSFVRNRVRGHLLPVLRTYNPAVDRALDRLARVVRDEDSFLADVVSEQCRSLVREEDRRATIDLDGWRSLPVAVQRRLIRKIAERNGVDELGFEAVERTLAVGAADGPRRAELGAGITVERRAATLTFEFATRMRDG